eukprot:TRINITY_DN1285_c0_g1_i1.p1 TRINITY_DN1285_c0_g1~~TRINITY_DN1285_c0_g1_i1.p1  ORF type:complete len:150 (-),score=49.80 TRINITY_DN1285_c0_g1_i1:146-595(-)
MGYGGKGKGSGKWVYVPAGSSYSKGGKSQGSKGWGKSKGWGNGKGKGKNISMVRKAAKSHSEKCVWIGGLKERETRKDADLNKALQGFINKHVEGCKFVDIGRNGSGGAIFGTAEEASAALSKLNGKKFQGCTLQLDVYVKGWTGDEEA